MLVMYVAALVRVDVNRSRHAGESPKATGRSNLKCRIKCPEYSSLRAGKGDNHSQQDRNEKEKRIKGAMRGKDPRTRVRNRKEGAAEAEARPAS
jgi:hypothetical protein